MAKRYEYKDAKSHKFWEVSVSGKKVNIRYGKVGTDGQTSVKELGTPAEAKAHAEKQAASKVKKGYKAKQIKSKRETPGDEDCIEENSNNTTKLSEIK